jgi:TP901 family phage tail tape measure protein
MPIVDDLVWRVSFRGWESWRKDVVKASGDVTTLDGKLLQTQRLVDGLNKKNLTLGIKGEIADVNTLSARLKVLQTQYAAYEAKVAAATGRSKAGYASQLARIRKELDATEKQFNSARLKIPTVNIDAYTKHFDYLTTRVSTLKAELRGLGKPDLISSGQQKDLTNLQKDLVKAAEKAKILEAELLSLNKQGAANVGPRYTKTVESKRAQLSTVNQQIADMRKREGFLSKPDTLSAARIASIKAASDELKQTQFALKNMPALQSKAFQGGTTLLPVEAIKRYEYLNKVLKTAESHYTTLGMQARRISSDIGSVANQFGVAAGAAAAFLGVASYQASHFGKKMAEVNSIAKYSDTQFASTKKQVLGLFGDLPVKQLDDLTSGLYNVVSSGVPVGNSMKVLGLSAKAAAAGQTDLETATKAGIGTLNAFQMPMSDYNKVLDYQFKLVDYGIGRYKDFQPILARVETSARLAGQSIPTAYGAIAQLTRMGYTPRLAGMSAARMFTDIVAKRSKIKEFTGVEVVDQSTGKFKDLVTIVGELRKKVDDGTLSATKLQKAFGNMTGLRGITSLVMSYSQFKDMVNGVKDSAGAMQAAFDKATDNIEDKMTLLKNNFVKLLISIGETPIVKGAVTKAVKDLEGLAKAIDKNSYGMESFITYSAIAIAGFGGLIFGGMKFASVLARGIGVAYSLRGALVSLELFRMAGDLRNVQGSALAAAKGMDTATGSALMLRGGLILAAAAAGWWIGSAINDWLNKDAVAAQRFGAKGLELASSLRVVGSATISTSDEFKKKEKVLDTLRSKYAGLKLEINGTPIAMDAAIKAFRAGKISVDEFSDAVANASSKMAQTRGTLETWADYLFFGGKGSREATPELQDTTGQGQILKDQLDALVKVRNQVEKGQKKVWKDLVLAIPAGSPMGRGTGFMGTGPSAINDLQKALGAKGFESNLTVDQLNKQIRTTRRQAILFFGNTASVTLGKEAMGSEYTRQLKSGQQRRTQEQYQSNVEELVGSGIDRATAKIAVAADVAATDPGKFRQLFKSKITPAVFNTVAGECSKATRLLDQAVSGTALPGVDAAGAVLFKRAGAALAASVGDIALGGEATPGSRIVTPGHIGTMGASGKIIETPAPGKKGTVGYRGAGRNLSQFTGGFKQPYYVLKTEAAYQRVMQGAFAPTGPELLPGAMEPEKQSKATLDSYINSLQKQIRQERSAAEIAGLRNPEQATAVEAIRKSAEADRREADEKAANQKADAREKLALELKQTGDTAAKRKKAKTLEAQQEKEIDARAVAEKARITREEERKVDLQKAQDALDTVKYNNSLNQSYRQAQRDHLNITATSAAAELDIIKSEYFDKRDSIEEKYQQALLDRQQKMVKKEIVGDDVQKSLGDINKTRNQELINAEDEKNKRLRASANKTFDAEMAGYNELRTANYDLYRDLSSITDSSFSHRIALIQEETNIQLAELKEQRDAYERTADDEMQTETQRINKRKLFAAQEKSIIEKSLKEQRDSALQQVETGMNLAEKLYGASNRAAFLQKPSDTVPGATDITPRATQSLMAFAKVYDDLLAKAEKSPEERAEVLLGYISTAIEKDKQKLNFYMDMLDLPRKKVTEIRQEFIDKGLFLGDEVVEAAQQNLQDIMEPMIDFQNTVKSGWSDAFKSAISGDLGDGNALENFGIKIADAYKSAMANWLTDEVIMPALGPAFQTPQQKALQDQMNHDLSIINYRKDIQNLEQIAMDTFRSGVDVFNTAVNNLGQIVSGVSAIPGLDGQVPTMPSATGLAIPDTASKSASTSIIAAGVAIGVGAAMHKERMPGTTVGAGNVASPLGAVSTGGIGVGAGGVGGALAPYKMTGTESILYGLGAAGAVATGEPWMGALSQLASRPGGIKGAWGAKANGLGNIMTGAGGFMSGYSQGATGGNIAMNAITGFATGGPIGGLIGVGATILGGFLGKGKRKKSEPPQPVQLQQMQGPEDIQWATKKYVRRAAEGGREGLPLSLGTRSNQANINSNVNVNFARIEIISADPRSAGADFVAGVSEGPAKVLASQISSSPSSR